MLSDKLFGGILLLLELACDRVETIDTGVTLVKIAELTGCGEYDVDTVPILS